MDAAATDSSGIDRLEPEEPPFADCTAALQ
jgi:hypothetical protein